MFSVRRLDGPPGLSSLLRKKIRMALSVVLLAALACGPAAPPPMVATSNPSLSPAPASERRSQEGVLPAPRPIALPADDAAHDVTTEWWYYNGHLKGEGDRDYGFELVVFKRQGTQGRHGYVGHMAVIDHRRKLFQFSEEIALPSPPPRIEGRFDVRAGDVQATGGGGQDAIVGSTRDYSLKLTLAGQRPAVLHGKSGYIGVSGREASYYYSRTRMQVQGVIVDHGERVPVTGLAWMDHQWGDFTLQGDGGWDWFSVQLEDGADMMVSLIRDGRGDPVLSYGTLVDQEGHSRHLASEEFFVQATGSWRSPVTGVEYPMGWTLSVPAQNIAIRLDPVLRDQEMDTSASVGRVYWEGEVFVTGTVKGQAVKGLGYVELTGYDRKPRPAGLGQG